MDSNNSSRSADEDLGKLIGILAMGIMIAGLIITIIILLIYAMVMAMIGGAIYLGAKLGSGGSVGKPPYIRVLELEAQKQEHMKYLKGETEEIQGEVDTLYENKKLQVYRPTDRPNPTEILKQIINRFNGSKK